MSAKQERQVRDEDELLKLQETLAAGKSRPAAKAVRIQRAGAPPPPPTPAPPAEEAGGVPMADAASVQAALQEVMKQIVGEVKEREVSSAASPPQPPAPSARPFPAAAHRGQSKFALARQRAQPAAAAAASGAGAGPGTGSTASPAAAGSEALPPPPPAAAAAAAGVADPSSIDTENRALLAGMTPEEVAAAREEALSRLPPGAAEFLRQRGAARERAQREGGRAPAAAAAAAAAPAAAEAEPRLLPSPAARPQPFPGSARAASPPADGGEGAGDGGGSAAARLRWGLDGRPAGAAPASEGSSRAEAGQVTRRDVLQQAAQGGAPQGYSLTEAALLARSSLPQQRVAALRLLAAVLSQARPAPSAAAGAAATVELPPEVAAALWPAEAPAARAVTWTEVWYHALHDVEVVMALRLALDDPHLAVIAAAAEALAALLGPGPEEEAAREAADACPLTGWPAVAPRHMQRGSAGGAWLAAPIAPSPAQQAARRGGGGGGGGGEDEEEGEEEVDERQLCKVDPLGGLMRTALAERAAYCLRTARAPGAADPLLSVLLAAACAGRDAARAVCAAPGMGDALKAVLDTARPQAGAEPAGAAYYAARPKALRLLRALAQASPRCAALLQETGLVRYAYDSLLRPPPAGEQGAAQAGSGEGEGEEGQAALGLHLESLRLWRCMGLAGVPFLRLQDAYAPLCRHFAPLQPAAAAAALAPGAAPPQAPSLLGWALAREAYLAAAQLCWQALSCEQPHLALASPACTAALLQQALAWLEALPLADLMRLCREAVLAPTAAGALLAAAGPRARGSSPFPALAALAAAAADGRQVAAAAVLSTLAAVLHFVGSALPAAALHEPGEAQQAKQRLEALGLLPAGAGPGSPSLDSVSAMLAFLVAEEGSGAAASHGAVAAVASLAVALARLAQVLLPSRAGGEGPSGPAAAYSLLAPLLSQQAAASFGRQAAGIDATLLQPWDLPHLQRAAHLARAAGAAAGQHRAAGGGGSDVAAVADASLAALAVLPPGDDAAALQLLAAVLSPEQLRATLDAAGAALDAADAAAATELAAAGSNYERPALPLARDLSPMLVAGYAGAWLGLVPEGGGEEGPPPVQPPAAEAALQPSGSRLPLVPGWVLAEGPLLPAEASSVEPGLAEGYSLLLALGWEEQGLSALQAVSPERKSRAAVALVFGGQPTAGEGLEDEPWRHPLARWALAALMHRWGAAAGAPARGSAGNAAGWGLPEAQQLVQRYTSASYGDPLFGAAVALLLRSDVPAAIQLEVWQGLAEERALHLLPPLARCFGPARLYLAGPVDRQTLDRLLALMGDAALARCLDTDSVALTLVLHRLATYLFVGEAASGPAAAAAAAGAAAGDAAAAARRRAAHLQALVRRCGGGEQRELLGLLLRWDVGAGRASDVVPAARAAFLEEACGGAGLMPTVMAALSLEEES